MTKTRERQSAILNVVRRGQTSVEELARMFSVSVATIRRDLISLENLGEIARTYGGATALVGHAESDTEERERKNWREKQAIAAVAIDMISPDMLIYLDAGTTVVALARRIALLSEEFSGLSVVTNSLLALSALEGASGIELTMLGGDYRPISRCTLGSTAEQMVREMRFDAAFLGADGLDADFGIGEENHRQISLKAMVMRRSARNIVLVDNSKIGKSGARYWAELPDDAYILTDQPPCQELERFNVQIAP